MSMIRLVRPLQNRDNDIDIERLKRDIPIESLIAQSFTVSGKGHTLTTAEHDSLKIFTHNNTWTWYSQAGRDGKNLGGSVIDWYMHMHQCGKGEAIRSLSAMLDGGALPTIPAQRPVECKEQPSAWKSPQWQADARRRLEVAQAALYGDASASGQAYLTERGICFDMWVAFGLGFADAWNIKAGRMMPALWLPWQNRQITAIQYRFLGVHKDDPDADRFGQIKGGTRYLFGLQHCKADEAEHKSLFLVEGELNAISIFQCVFGQHVADVISFGPRNNITVHNRDMITTLASRYRQVIIWADEPEDAAAALSAIPSALPVQSPEIDGKRCDANDLLCAGILNDVVDALCGSDDMATWVF